MAYDRLPDNTILLGGEDEGNLTLKVFLEDCEGDILMFDFPAMVVECDVCFGADTSEWGEDCPQCQGEGSIVVVDKEACESDPDLMVGIKMLDDLYEECPEGDFDTPYEAIPYSA